jgi:hypothetical protein
MASQKMDSRSKWARDSGRDQSPAAVDRFISEMVNDAVKASLAQDAEDLEAFDRRRRERSVSLKASCAT